MKIGAFLLFVSLLSCGQEHSEFGLRKLRVPDYPFVARKARIQGDVQLEVTVQSNGKILSVDSSSGPEILASYAKINVMEWVYTPLPSSEKVTITYTYRLESPETEREVNPKVEFESPVHVVITSKLPRVVG